MRARRFFLIGLFFLAGCTQEHLLFLRNLDRAKLVTMDQILKESGLADLRDKRKTAPTNAVDKKVEPVNSEGTDVKAQVFSANRTVSMAAGEEFSLTPPAADGLTVLKNVQGGVTWFRDKSRPEENFYFFRAGATDGKVSFQIHADDGTLLTNWNVFIQVRKTANSGGSVSQASLPITNRIAAPVSESRAVVDNSGGNQPLAADQSSSAESSGASSSFAPASAFGGIAPEITATLRGLSPVEALSELRKMMAAPGFTDADREVIRLKLVETLIKERMLTEAEAAIAQVSDPSVKYYWQGKVARAGKQDRDAMRYYLLSLSGDAEVRKTAIRELESLALSLGVLDVSFADRLQAESDKLKQDQEFYGNSLIDIAKLRMNLKDVYTAEDLLNRVIAGDFSPAVVKRANDAMDELKREFLEYR
jgi:hypothetical protein